MTAHRFTSGTELGLPECVCLRCATLQTPPGSSVCRRPRPPVLMWSRRSADWHVLHVDGHGVASATSRSGLWSWETYSPLVLLRMLPSQRARSIEADLNSCKKSCEAFVLQHLDIVALERLRERIGAS